MISYDANKRLYVHSDPAAPRFKEFVAGVGWMDPTGTELELMNWATIVGHREDGEYEVVEEICSNLSGLCDKLTDAKDRWMVKRIFCDRSNPTHIEVLSKHDGLVRYFHSGRTRAGKKLWLHPNDHWAHFRSRERIALIPLIEQLTVDTLSAAELVDRLTSKGLLGVRGCPRLEKIMGLSPAEVVRHPAIKALAYPLIVLEREKARASMPDEANNVSLYPNLRR
jgi:hypothetical protein